MWTKWDPNTQDSSRPSKDMWKAILPSVTAVVKPSSIPIFSAALASKWVILQIVLLLPHHAYKYRSVHDATCEMGRHLTNTQLWFKRTYLRLSCWHIPIIFVNLVTHYHKWKVTIWIVHCKSYFNQIKLRELTLFAVEKKWCSKRGSVRAPCLKNSRFQFSICWKLVGLVTS